MAERRCISGNRVPLGPQIRLRHLRGFVADALRVHDPAGRGRFGAAQFGDDEIQLLVETGLLRQQSAVKRLERREPIAVSVRKSVQVSRVARAVNGLALLSWSALAAKAVASSGCGARWIRPGRAIRRG